MLPALIDKIDEWHSNPGQAARPATGFTDFDKITGGLRGGDLVIVAGRPSMGKTTLAVNMAENAARESERASASVLIFSMEMPSEQLMTRMLSSVGGVPLSDIRSGRISDEDWVRITSATSQLSEARIFIDETPGLTPTDLRARARRVKREHGLDLVVVDYLQLMQVPGTKENRATEISEISRGLKALAKELRVPVIALSQLNRSVEQREHKKPVMSDLRESGAIEQDADMILLIYREEVYDKNTTQARASRTSISPSIATARSARSCSPSRASTRASRTSRPIPTRKACCGEPARSGPSSTPGRCAAIWRRCARVAPGSQVMAVVKANAYGHGLVPTALALAGCRCVRRRAARRRRSRCARRASRSRSCCSKVCSRSEQLLEAARHGFDLVVHDPLQIELLEEYRGAQRFVVWLKIDTGMNRLGFRPEEFAAALERVRGTDAAAARDPRADASRARR